MANTPKLPPQNIEAEQSLIGALLIDKDAIVRVAELLHAGNFYRSDTHGQIFSAMKALFEKREPIDLVTLTEQLKKEGTYDKIGGVSYLTTLVNIVPTSAHIEHYARIIKEHAIRRNLITNATKLIEEAYNDSGSVDELLESAEAGIFSLSQEHVKRDFTAIRDALTQSFDRLDELQKSSGKLRGVPTGFRDLDSKLAGMQDSNLIILASRPGQGKTSFALNVAQFVAVNSGLPVGIFSLEMSQEELVDRLLVAQADIDAWKLKTGRLDEKDFDRLSQAMGELAEASLFIDDTPGISMSEMRTKARRLQIEHGLKLLIVDYLQLVHGRNLENRVQEVSEISQNLKNLARELKIPVLAISQLSRAVESRGTRRPQLADLRESGAIEQDADVVMFIYREDPEKPEQVILDIQKHRNGPTGEINLMFRAERVKFYGMEKQRGRAVQTEKEETKLPAAA
ncbi:replicative DNA helicase [Candidatus Daviesbacteria bacterium RIFCSPHIGHO2_12_FULL_37_11]|uniref:Replicative DNA helicase n=1 Tax=Candidatus Daviesbacteria bacterium RIFCSPHIGHO2_12_FULL_37_11 TaxID=1797777 RepID=A0A1F5KDK5_9BACT|nr:MAG: replicative DNA helicase [Candidatus Daviesbacteria bacterium RIFCSPHIGHO2_12_FULL_37_11]